MARLGGAQCSTGGVAHPIMFTDDDPGLAEARAFQGDNLFTWHVDGDGGSFPPQGTLEAGEWTFDPVRGCVFQALLRFL